MGVDVLVPPLGQTVDTLVLVSWFKQEGEHVAAGEPLFAVETDKAMLDVESPASGILSGVTAGPGDRVKVLSPIAVIRAEGEVAVGTAPMPGAPATAARLFVSPRARRLAEAEGVALIEVRATGPEGAIVERDVRAHMQQIEAQRPGPALEESAVTGPAITPVARRIAEEAGFDWRNLTGTGTRGQITRQDVEQAVERQTARPAAGQPETRVSPQLSVQPAAQAPHVLALSGVRALIAERMMASHQGTAAVTLTTEADATEQVALRRKLVADGVPVSYNDLFLVALARALREHPRLNASFAADGIRQWPQIDIGLAVDAPRGLLVPVVRGVDRKRLAELAAETADLTERARAGRCAPEELAGGTFTLTNLGMFGIDAFTPIINLPECAILGIGRIKTQPEWLGDHVEPCQKVWLSLTFDHRLVDGGPAARFLQRVAELTEKPHLLMA